MTDDRNTEEIILKLGGDCNKCQAALVQVTDTFKRGHDGQYEVTPEYEFWSRQFVRAVFAYIEAVTFSVKAISAIRCLDNNVSISPQERYFSIDTEYDLNDKGEVVETVAKISLAKNVRFAIALNRKALGIKETFDASIEWWSCFKKSVRVRDRLTHPKFPEDLDLSANDVLDVMKTRRGFEDELLTHSIPDTTDKV